MKRRHKNEEGQALVEFALVLPILLLVVCGIIDFGWLFYNQLSLQNACREGARLAVVSAEVEAGQRSAEVFDKVKENLPGNLQNPEADLQVDIVYTDSAIPVNGNVEVTTTAKMQFLTPLMGTIYQDSERTMSYTITMKVES